MTPNVYPTGGTIYDPEKAWSGYSVEYFNPCAVYSVVILEIAFIFNQHFIQYQLGVRFLFSTRT